jgi:small subunit ribosomal protein S16
MAVSIRLRRTGGKNEVHYRVVATDSRFPRDGRFLEILGWYDPKREGTNFSFKMDRVEYWESVGAQASDTVRNLLRKARRKAA